MTALLNRLLNTVNINDDRTFTVKVDDGFSASHIVLAVPRALL